MPEKPAPLPFGDPGFHTIPTVRSFDCLLPRTDDSEARLRFRIGAAATLDIPISQESLIALANDVNLYLAKRK
jgi:hypothetical protein